MKFFTMPIRKKAHDDIKKDVSKGTRQTTFRVGWENPYIHSLEANLFQEFGMLTVFQFILFGWKILGLTIGHDFIEVQVFQAFISLNWGL
jgi:hypothetical protein